MGWPSTGGVDGRRLAESLRDGDKSALTWIWDAYAMRLYDYCHGLLRNREAAADAVHDTLIIAQQRIGGLRQPERFRGWLYAIARTECLRRRGDPRWPPNVVVAPEATDAVIDSEEWAKREETRRQVHGAISTLSGPRREIVDLGTRHELDPPELAGVLGLSVPRATELFQQACDELGSRLTVIMGDEVSVPRMLHVLPIADIPTGLWTRIRETAGDPGRAADRTALARRAGPFDAMGWPATNRSEQSSRSSRRAWPVFGAVAAAVVVAGAVVALLPDDGGHGQIIGDRAPVPRPGADGSPSLPPGEFAPRSGSPSPKQSPTTSTTPSPNSSKSKKPASPSQRGGPGPGPGPGSQPPPQSQPPGTPVVSGCDMNSGSTSCTVSVTASGGPVDWSVTGTSNQLSASGGGALPAGQTAYVTVQRHGWCLFGGSGSVSFAPTGDAPVNWTC